MLQLRALKQIFNLQKYLLTQKSISINNVCLILKNIYLNSKESIIFSQCIFLMFGLLNNVTLTPIRFLFTVYFFYRRLKFLHQFKVLY